MSYHYKLEKYMDFLVAAFGTLAFLAVLLFVIWIVYMIAAGKVT